MNANLIHITPKLGLGGAERLLLNLLPLLRDAGWQQTVISLLPGGELQDEFLKLNGSDISIEILNIRKSSPASFLQGYGQLRKIMKSQPKGSIVQGWLYHGNVTAFSATPFLKKPYHLIWGIHAAGFEPHDFSLPSRITLRISRLISHINLDKIIYCSRQAKKDHENFGFPTAKGTVIENGVDTTLLRDVRLNRAKARQLLEISDDDYVVACIARHSPQKNIPNLFAAVQMIPKGKRPVILLVGTGMSFDNPDFVVDFNASGLTRDTCRIKAVGPQSDPYFFLASADVLVLPSAFGEAQPLSILESVAAGIPVIATSVGGVPELVERLGLKIAIQLVLPRTPGSLAEAIMAKQQHFLANSDGEHTYWWRDIEQHYRLERTFTEYDTLYRSLL